MSTSIPKNAAAVLPSWASTRSRSRDLIRPVTIALGVIALLMVCILPAANAATASGATIEKQSLGPAPATKPMQVSPAGQHVAWVALAGSRTTVVVDGVAGPAVDQILSNEQVVFSDDGTRSAWFGRVGGEYVVIVDGKELTRGPFAGTTLQYGPLGFSPGGGHVYFTEADTSQGYRLVIDGKPGPWSSSPPVPAFSPDDRHYAYNGPERMNNDVWFSVVDGKKLDFIGNYLQYTNDNRLISVAQSKDGGYLLLVNGVPTLKGNSIGNIWLPPQGTHIAASVQQAGDSVLYVDGKPVADAVNPQEVIFSPDGNHYAAICYVGTGRNFVVIDGKKGQEYAAIFRVAFTADSSQAVYVASSSGRQFVVANGKEFGGYLDLQGTNDKNRGLMTSKVGGHYIFLGNLDRAFHQELVWDGKQVPLNGLVLDYVPVLSANGSRYAFAVHPQSSNTLGLVDDGKLLAGINPVQMGTEFGRSSAISHILLSPDGKHAAYMASLDGSWKKGGLFVDGKVVYANPKRPEAHPFINFIAFTPDSRHLVWLGSVLAEGAPSTPVFFVDGKAVLQLSRNSPFDNLPVAWHIEADGTVQFLSVADDGTLLRYRITPPSDSGIAGNGNESGNL